MNPNPKKTPSLGFRVQGLGMFPLFLTVLHRDSGTPSQSPMNQGLLVYGGTSQGNFGFRVFGAHFGKKRGGLDR